MDWATTWKLIKSDIVRRTVTDGKAPTFRHIAISTLSPPALAVILYRLQHYFYHKRLYALCKIIAYANIVFFSVEIGSRCEAGEGFLLGHANCIGIHDQVKIGKNCTLMHQSAVGIKYKKGTPHDQQFTVLGDDVFVGSGAKILGPGVIGSGSRIGMNALATGSYPERSVIVGVPGQILRQLREDNDFTPEVTGRTCKDKPRVTLKKTFKRIHQDLRQRAYIDGKIFSLSYYLKLFFSPPALAVFLFRWANYFEGVSFRLLAKVLTTINIMIFKTEIGSKAKIEGGFVLGHANGVIINNQVKIGKNAVFFHHNTVAIGPRADSDPENDRVVIGDNFLAGAGARILGNIELGNDVTVGMNAVVTHSAPDGAVLAGIPARNLKNGPLKKQPDVVHPIPDSNVSTFSETIEIIKTDIRRRAELEDKKANLFYYVKVLINPPAMAVVLFRWAHFFEKNGYHLPAKILSNINNVLYTTEIQAPATIGPGLVIAHANGVVVGDKAVIGKNCLFTLHNSIVVGPREGLDAKNDRVVIGDNAFFGMGSRIIGNIRLGNNITVGVNSVVTRSAPDDAVLLGIPARQKS